MNKKVTKAIELTKKVEETLDRERTWYRELDRLLLNRKIIDVKWEEWDDSEDYFGTGITFLTDNGVKFFLSQDDEGNGPGALHWSSKTNHGILPVGVMAYNELLELEDSVIKEEK